MEAGRGAGGTPPRGNPSPLTRDLPRASGLLPCARQNSEGLGRTRQDSAGRCSDHFRPLQGSVQVALLMGPGCGGEQNILDQWPPTFFAPETSFMEDSFSRAGGMILIRSTQPRSPACAVHRRVGAPV